MYSPHGSQNEGQAIPKHTPCSTQVETSHLINRSYVLFQNVDIIEVFTSSSLGGGRRTYIVETLMPDAFFY